LYTFPDLICDLLPREVFIGNQFSKAELTMHRETERIAVGTRFQMSELGAVRCPRLANKVGTVVGSSRYNSGLTVLFDGNKTPTCLHRDYISPASAPR